MQNTQITAYFEQPSEIGWLFKMASIPVFLSAPKPFLSAQENFMSMIESKLRDHGLEPRTLGRSEYDMNAPLEGIRRLMIGSCGLITLAFRRTFIVDGVDRPNSDINEKETKRIGCWLTSPYCHIEPAMAFQLGLPLLIWREVGVLADGVLDRGAIGIGMPEFDLSGSPPTLDDPAWRTPFRQWVVRVETVHNKRGAPPRLWE